MNQTKQALADIFAAQIAADLKIMGFKKKGLNWIVESPDCILVFNIQRSSWGGGVYFNAGLFIRKLGDEKLAHLFYKADLYGRVEDLCARRSKLRALIKKAESGEIGVNDITELRNGIVNSLIPELLRYLNLKELPSLMNKLDGNWLIRPEVSAYL